MTQKAFAIRMATADDLDAICQADQDLFDSPVKPNRLMEFLADPRHHLVLAFSNKSIVGMGSAFHYVHPDKHPTLFINEVGVLDPYQNRGIGRSIVETLCDYGRSLGCMEIWIGTEVSNTAARRAFVAAGGQEDKEPFILINF